MRVILCAFALLCAACGGRSPVAPSPTPAPLPVPVTWTLSGSVVSTTTRQPISGAHLSGFEVSTDNAGQFSATGTGVRSSQRVTIDAPGFVTRETMINAGTNAPTLDLFPMSSLTFYRQMVRDGFQSPANLQPVRHTSATQFYISRTPLVTDEDIRRTMIGIQIAVSQLTTLWPVGIQVGPPRGDQLGWITVDFVPEMANCGSAFVAMNPGHVSLSLKPYSRGGCANYCPGAQIVIGTVAHEVGHALGFWHTSSGVMQAGSALSYSCSDALQFTPAEKDAALIASHRLTGNSDPDVDLTGLAFLESRRVLD